MLRTNQKRGRIVLALLVFGALVGCESFTAKDDPEPEMHPLTEFTRQLVVDGVADARQGIDPRNRVIDRLGLSGEAAQQWYDVLDHRRARKSETTLEEFLDVHQDLDATERRQIEEVFAIASASSSPEDLDTRLDEFRASRNIRDTGAPDAYIAIFQGLAHGYRDLHLTALSADSEQSAVSDGYGYFKKAQYQHQPDGRFDYPPERIESWQEFAQGAVLAGLAGGAIGAGSGAIICSPSVLITAGIGPVACALGIGVAGFIIGSGMYMGVSLVTAQIDYEGELNLWCNRQSSYIVKNDQYDTLCDEYGQARHN